ncbi:unnamed protein product [Arctogadus glacialis]
MDLGNRRQSPSEPAGGTLRSRSAVASSSSSSSSSSNTMNKDCRQVAFSVGACCVEAQGLHLVPRPSSCSTGPRFVSEKKICFQYVYHRGRGLLSLAPPPLCFSVFTFVFPPLLCYSLHKNVFQNS